MNHALHFVGRGVLKANGFSWEIRRQGEIQLGYWKKTLKKKDPGDPYPKRVVFIPGFGDSPLSWFSVAALLQPILKSQFDEVLLFDFPGFGGFLQKERSFPSMDMMISMVGDTLDSLKPHSIIGHSLGGWLTAFYASACGSGTRPLSNQLNYSGPKTIILANPSGTFKDAQVRQNWETLFRSAMTEGFSKVRPHLFSKEPLWFPLLCSHFENMYVREDILQFMGSFREDHVVDPILPNIKSDLWLLWGEKDTLIPASCASTWLEKAPLELRKPERVVILKGVGHSPQVEAPLATSAVLAQILMAGKKVPRWVGQWWWKFLNDNELKQIS